MKIFLDSLKQFGFLETCMSRFCRENVRRRNFLKLSLVTSISTLESNSQERSAQKLTSGGYHDEFWKHFSGRKPKQKRKVLDDSCKSFCYRTVGFIRQFCKACCSYWTKKQSLRLFYFIVVLKKIRNANNHPSIGVVRNNFLELFLHVSQLLYF